MPVYDAFRDGGGSPRVRKWSSGLCFDYRPSQDFDANNSEFWVDGTEGYTFAHNGAYTNVLTLYFRVDYSSLVEQQKGHILALATYVREPIDSRYAPHVGEIDERVVTAQNDTLPLCLENNNTSDLFTQIVEFAFFLDVKRLSGEIDRLWLKNGARNFSLPDIKDFEASKSGPRPGYNYYVRNDSPLFNQLRASHR